MPCEFGCQVLSAEAMARFKQQEIVLGDLSYVGAKAFDGCKVRLEGDVLGV